MPEKKRIFELDFLRGLALLAMCFDHFCFDCTLLPDGFPRLLTNNGSSIPGALFQFGNWFFHSTLRQIGHNVFATLFLLLAGIGCTLSHSIFRKAGRTALGAICITAVTGMITLLADLDVLIVFGILHSMTIAFLLYAILSKLRDNRWVYLAAGLLIVAVGIGIQWNEAPVCVVLTWDTVWRIALGTLSYGADWFPIFPTVGIVLVGAFLGKTLYSDRRSLLSDRPYRWARPICVLGRHSLWIYLLHQPLLAGMLFVFCVLFGAGR